MNALTCLRGWLLTLILMTKPCTRRSAERSDLLTRWGHGRQDYKQDDDNDTTLQQDGDIPA